jgi:hypothetical protein
MEERSSLEKRKITKPFLEAMPYPVVSADLSHTIRCMNRIAVYEYEEMRCHRNLLGSSLLVCRDEQSCQNIGEIVARFEQHGGEEFLMVTSRNQHVSVTPVRDEEGSLAGYFERYELNEQK